jgi:hypothetical protein
MRKLIASVFVFAVAAACAGCLKIVTFRTVLQPDGAVERHVVIESVKAPDVDSDLILPPKKGWQTYRNEPKRFEARGLFKSVADIPLDWQKRVKDDKKKDGKDEPLFAETSKSVKEYRRFDCALFTTHEYTETIRDVTSIEQFAASGEALLALRTLVYAVAEEGWGKTYDFSRAKQYVEDTLVPRARVAAMQYWAARVDKRPGLEQRLKQLVTAHAKALGVAVPEKAAHFGDAFERWALAKLRELLVRRDGAAVTEADVKALMQGSVDADGARKDDGLAARVRVAVIKRYGSEDKAEQALAPQLYRLAGAYLQFLAHHFRFSATVVMPGQIVESNGTVDGNEATWAFAHADIFPYYRMTARSVTFKRANERGGRALVPSAAHALRLADAVGLLEPERRTRIVAAIAELARTGSADRFREARFREAAQGEEDERLERVLEELGLGGEL